MEGRKLKILSTPSDIFAGPLNDIRVTVSTVIGIVIIWVCQNSLVERPYCLLYRTYSRLASKNLFQAKP